MRVSGLVRRCGGILAVAGIAFYYGMTLYGGAGMLVFPCTVLLAGVYVLLPGRLALGILPNGMVPKKMEGAFAVLLGIGFLLGCYLVAVRVWRPFLTFAPLLSAVAGAVLEGWKLFNKKQADGGKLRPGKQLPTDFWLLAGLFGFFLMVYSFAGPALNALPTAVGSNAIHQDILWNVGNAAALKKSFPPWDLRFLGVPLKYHFFTDLLVAIFSMLSGASCYEVALFGLQPLVLAAMLHGLYSLGQVFYKGDRRRTLALVLLVASAGSASLFFTTKAGQDLFGNNFIEHLVTNINAQTTAVWLAAIFLGLFFSFLRQDKPGIGRMLPVVYVYLLLSVAKGPVALVVLCGALAGLGLYLVKNKANWQGVLLGVLLAGGFATVYQLLFSGGASSSMWLDFTDTLRRGIFNGGIVWLEGRPAALGYIMIPMLIVLQAVLILPLPVALAARGFVLVCKRGMEADRFTCYAGAGAGMAAFFAFGHQSYSQSYFFFAAVLFLCLAAAEGLVEGMEIPAGERTRRWRGRLIFGVFIIGLCTALVNYSGLVGRGAGRMLQGPQQAEPLAVYSAEDEKAAVWLRDNTPRDTIFATNRISAGTGHYKNIANFYTAISERQAQMEGYKYVESNMGIPWQMLEDRVVANAALFDSSTPPEEILRIARERNIHYLLYSELAEGSDEQLEAFELVFSGEGVRLYKVG